MTSLSKKVSNIIFSIDFVALVAMLVSAFFPLTWPFPLPIAYWIKQGIEHSLLILFYFGNVFLLHPLLYRSGHRISFILISVFVITIIILVCQYLTIVFKVDEALAKTFFTHGHPFKPDHSSTDKWLFFESTVVFCLSYVSAVTKKLHTSQLAYEISEKDRVTAELSFLKAQINPHFFFNTLNTIYSLQDTEPVAAKDALYTLSHMMRYVIYETDTDETTLTKEVAFIDDYIKLMKARLPKSVQVIFDQNQLLNDCKMAPMLFLPFVENAFKHGTRVTSPSYVLITVATSESNILLEVRNSTFNNVAEHLEEGSGIGIANTKRRLDLLYPGKYNLVIDDDHSAMEYTVKLILDVNDN